VAASKTSKPNRGQKRKKPKSPRRRSN
jgi:hypothetical protein